MVFEGGGAGEDGVFESGFAAVGLEAFLVGRDAFEFEGIHGGHVWIHFHERARIDKKFDAFAGAQGEMVAALRADL